MSAKLCAPVRNISYLAVASKKSRESYTGQSSNPAGMARARECECRERTSADISGTNEAVYRFKRYTYVGGGRTPAEMMMYLVKSPGIFVAVVEVDVGRYNASRRTGGNEKIQPGRAATRNPYRTKFPSALLSSSRATSEESLYLAQKVQLVRITSRYREI